MDTRVHFIKLGPGGIWERDCIRDGVLRFGYHKTPHSACTAEQWNLVREALSADTKDAGTVTRHLNQIKIFYTAPESDVFITFSGGLLYWCHAAPGVTEEPDGSRVRNTVDGWKCTSRGGKRLSTDKLSGHLLRVQGYRGTVCRVDADEYLLRKISDTLDPGLAQAEDAEAAHVNAIQGLLKRLEPKDFEILVDLVFARSGWRRVAQLGGTGKMVDLELLLPTTGDRAFVQVKSRTSRSTLNSYVKSLRESEGFDHMFFVWHTATLDEDEEIEVEEGAKVTLIGPRKLAYMVLDAGLSRWLREKVS